MTYTNIKKYLGEEWLKKQIEFIESKEWVDKRIPKESVSSSIGYYILNKIETLLIKFDGVEGFDEWVKESKNDRNFKNYLFELIVLENLLSKTDSLKLKPKNNVKIPEALIKKGDFSFYVEMTNLESIPTSIDNKIEKMFKKARDKFKGSQGIHFISIFNFFNWDGKEDKPLPEFEKITKKIRLKFHYRENKCILAFILVNFYITTTPDFKNSSLQKRYYIFNKPLSKGGKPNEFFKEIFDVDKFLEV